MRMRETRKVGNRFVFLLSLLHVLLAFGVFTGSSHAMTVSLTWDPSADSEVIGYKVYYQANSSAVPFAGTGASEGSAPIDNGTLTSATVDGLDPANVYFFAVTAYTADGLESDYSNIISIHALAPTTDTPPPSGSGTFDLQYSLLDAVQALQVAAGNFTPTGDQMTRLDVAPYVDGRSYPNGKVDTGDVVVILTRLVQ